MRVITYILISAMVVLLATACPKPAPTPPANQPGSGGTQSGQGSTANQPDGSTATGGKGAMVSSVTGATPEGWPQDVPVMQGFIIGSGMVNSQSMLSVIAAGPVDLDSVSNFYSSLPGWEKDPNSPWITKGTQRQLKLIKGTSNLNVSAYESEGQTRLSLTYWVK